MAVAIGAGCDFLTPIGHQCNTLVMGPGGYRFSDYPRLGLPLSLIVLIVAVPMLMLVWPHPRGAGWCGSQSSPMVGRPGSGPCRGRAWLPSSHPMATRGAGPRSPRARSVATAVRSPPSPSTRRSPSSICGRETRSGRVRSATACRRCVLTTCSLGRLALVDAWSCCRRGRRANGPCARPSSAEGAQTASAQPRTCHSWGAPPCRRLREKQSSAPRR